MHSCPECGQACYCSGDCEDHDTGGEFLERCTHPEECVADDEYDDELDDWGDDHGDMLPRDDAFEDDEDDA